MNLLIVDDEPRTRNGLVSLIQKSSISIDIQTAAGSEEALSVVKTFLPDILITDIRMPLQADGIMLAENVSKLFPNCQIIFISAYSDKEYLKSAISLKAIRYIEKPIVPAELLEALREAIHIKKKNELSMEKELFLEQHWDVYAEKIALQLLFPDIDPVYLDKLKLFYPAFCGQQYYFTLICQLHYRKASADSLFDFPGLFKDILNNGYTCLFAPKKEDLYIIHLCIQNPENELCYQSLANRLFEELRQRLSSAADIFVSVGRPVSCIEELSISYLEAAVSLKKLFFSGYNEICFFKEADYKMASTYLPDAAFVQNFEQALQNKNYREADILATRLFHSLQAEVHKDVSSIKDTYFHLVLTADSFYKKEFPTTVLSVGNNFLWEEIVSKRTLRELHDYLVDKLNDYSAKMTEKHEFSSTVYKIRQYIEQHFTEPELSVNKIAEQLHFTPAYLCQVFKKDTGNTINSYLNACRIDHAKTLIAEKNVKLYDVCFLVGYNDPNYFSRQFKKNTGYTPSAYKEKHII